MSHVEWLVLSNIGGLSLKSSVVWSDWVGSNYYGFSALPVGYIEDGKYDLFGTYAVFIEPQEHDNLKAKVHYIMENSHREASVQKSFPSSIRCVEDYEEILWK